MKRWLVSCAAAAILASPAALAFFHTYEVEQVYSNFDGTIQFVTLITTFNGENFSMGEPFTSTDLAGSTKTYTFDKNLPSSATAGKHVLIATQSFAAMGVVTPDFTIPDHFIPTGGGTVGTRFSTMSYRAGQLPIDGVNALPRASAEPRRISPANRYRSRRRPQRPISISTGSPVRGTSRRPTDRGLKSRCFPTWWRRERVPPS
jgi:hypothetical protein